jgi:hypothetical protein
MSWHASIIGVKAPTLSPVGLANSLGYTNENGTIDFESATSSIFEGAAFAECDGWIIGTNGMGWFDIGEVGKKLATINGIEMAIAVMTEGTSGTHSFDLVKNGKLVRRILSQEGEIFEEHGNKTEMEIKADLVSEITDDGEDHVLSIFTDTVTSMDELLKLQMKAFEASMD